MQQKYQVIILGSGIAGTMLAAILARHKVKVLVIDKGSHPKFAIGESTIPYTTFTIAGISELFDIPELHPANIRQKVLHSCGIKKNLSFAYHHAGKEQIQQEVTQSNSGVAELHFFRQDLDSYLLQVAIRYGVNIKQNCNISDIEFSANGKDVLVTSTEGEEFLASYVVDAIGYSSILAKKFDLRENPTHLKSHTRSLFTHMIDVPYFEVCVHPQKVHSMPVNFYEGTVHHLFDGGWIWVIPFNNHKDSTNPLCSVGLQLDARRFPNTDIPPEQEFFEIISKYPSISKQFKNAKSVRDWISIPRLQYSSQKCVGDRYCLIPNSYGFVDPLFSRGLASNCGGVKYLATLILEATKEDDFSEKRFQHLNEVYRKELDLHDSLVYGAYISFKDFELWKCWQGVWTIAEFINFFQVVMTLNQLKNGNPNPFKKLDIMGPIQELNPFIKEAVHEMEQVDKGNLSTTAAAKNIKDLLQQIDFLPEPLKFSFSRRFFKPSMLKLMEVAHWLEFKSTPNVRSYYETFNPFKFSQVVKEMAKR
ncbi:hypothetical protein AMR41_05765 [Hapalosiphon sp. MRB220]|nr:hypothetical protein AMR41_05765 [Hapalosiphon sp. MRB220]